MKSLKNLFTVFVVFFMFPLVNGQNIAKDAMVANWYISPLEDVSIEKFQNYILEDYIPELKKIFPGVNFYLLKNDRGRDEGLYSIMVIFKSIEQRNEWWPEKGVSSDKAKAAMEKMGKLGEKFDALAEMPSWNDWLVL